MTCSFRVVDESNFDILNFNFYHINHSNNYFDHNSHFDNDHDQGDSKNPNYID